MRIPFYLIAFTLLGAGAWAQATEKRPWYLQWSVGAVSSENATGVPTSPPGQTIRFDPGYATGIAIGHTSSLSSRVDLDLELEGFYQYFTVEAGDMLKIPSAVKDDGTTFAFMANGTLDWKFTPQYAMYFGAGLGYASHITYEPWDSGNLVLQDDSAPAYQGRFGFAYNLGGNYEVRLGYRYFHTIGGLDIKDLITNEVDSLDIGQHTIEIGVRWGI